MKCSPSNADLHVSEDPPHGHILSDKSTELQRDTFIFAPMGGHPIRLVLGLNQTLTPLSSATLRRWAHLMTGYPPDLFLCPVQVKIFGIMSYSMSPSGPIIDPQSTDPLPPGNYGWYLDRDLATSGFTDLTGVNPAVRNQSFEYVVADLEEERLCALYKFSPDLEHRVLERDALQCRVTGATTDVIPTWIVPPPWAWTVANDYDPPGIAPRWSESNTAIHPVGIDPTAFLVAANAITLRKDIKVHFYNHNFTVDADDNYRVVILRDMGEAQKLLPTHLPRHPHYDDNDATFFRLHLRYSMNFMLLGGDVSEKYPPHRILHEMELLGVAGPGDDPDDYEMAPLSDERWGTDLGKAILADTLRARMQLSLYYSDQSDDSDQDSDPAPTTDDAAPRVQFFWAKPHDMSESEYAEYAPPTLEQRQPGVEYRFYSVD
ncbi:hypothetical protein DFH07DRAFT_1058382 [Mycena maculata]|uniref:Uncharacterized protein n=1 Tax=Mycena maculata TaxID=230809 RepID=A0AAD7JRQ0_9AGAR|nr:hypothetical protein DFH07DRAFT_1058382 [Mycena maculata]